MSFPNGFYHKWVLLEPQEWGGCGIGFTTFWCPFKIIFPCIRQGIGYQNYPHGLFAVWDGIWEAILGTSSSPRPVMLLNCGQSCHNGHNARHVTARCKNKGLCSPHAAHEHHLLKCTCLHWRSSGTPFNTLLLLGASLFLVTCSSLYPLSVRKNLKLVAIERHDFLWSVDEDLKPTYILYHVH